MLTKIIIESVIYTIYSLLFACCLFRIKNISTDEIKNTKNI
ncbi:hypothetical protein JBKA6_1346 [Ichthyobacterium seriolicida]|uniref:Uncharacterized protein n=1 Tax=Ichthyobacterium seriolicida TaxID=242600 RepID=A0A1J1DZL4_9FLAO|nr:hypothetical protein JBKA6_1346 [Ichthyobacterium seriolicida]